MTWEHEKDFDNGVTVKRRTESNPQLLAVFDEGERVSEPVAALQAENVAWMASGYSDAKAEYCDDIDNEQDS